MNPKDVVSYIEREPFISVVPVEPGLTNIEKEENGQRIVGMNTKNAEINEGLIRFDIIFYVRMKDGISQVIVNVEGQKDEPTGCHILNRAVFYVSRLVSSQKEQNFVKTNYNDIKRFFSIWVWMGMDENSMDYVHLTDDKLLGSYSWKGRPDLLNIVLTGISNELPEHDEKYELHRLLSTLLSMELTVDEKLGIIEKEYSIVVDLVFSLKSMALVGYFTIALKPLTVRGERVSNTIKRKIMRVSDFDSQTQTYTMSAYLIAQPGKNYTDGRNKEITGAELLELAWSVIEDMQYMGGGMVVFLEANDEERLLAFYQDNKFRQFDTRLTASDATNQHELVQLLRLL